MSSHTDAIHIGAMEIDGSRMMLPRKLSVEMGAIHIRRYCYSYILVPVLVFFAPRDFLLLILYISVSNVHI